LPARHQGRCVHINMSAVRTFHVSHFSELNCGSFIRRWHLRQGDSFAAFRAIDSDVPLARLNVLGGSHGGGACLPVCHKDIVDILSSLGEHIFACLTFYVRSASTQHREPTAIIAANAGGPFATQERWFLPRNDKAIVALGFLNHVLSHLLWMPARHYDNVDWEGRWLTAPYVVHRNQKGAPKAPSVCKAVITISLPLRFLPALSGLLRRQTAPPRVP
jgi:hypothetical protein